MEIVMAGLEIARRLSSRVGPYLIVELIVPDGTLLAVLLYLYRRRAGTQKIFRGNVDPAQGHSTRG